MTTKKRIEILKEFEKKFDLIFKTGICQAFLNYKIYYGLSDNDYIQLQKLMHFYFPAKQKTNAYCWPQGKIKPRKEWLKQFISNLENS